jgi:hypothetical protein
MNTDHAEDQKKLVQLFKWKGSCEWEMQGEEAILSASLADLIPLCWEETKKNIASAGGQDRWDALSPDECEQHKKDSYCICIHLGEDAIDAMSPKECQYIALFL